MRVVVHFYSYFKDLAGCTETVHELPAGATLGLLLDQVISRVPRFEGVRNSVLLAVGVEYQDQAYVLKDGDEVSMFPPVQGG